MKPIALILRSMLVVGLAIGMLGITDGWTQQPAKVPRIGMLSGSPPPAGPNPYAEALREGLRQLGWEKVDIEVRYAAGKMDRLPALAAELVALPVDVIVGGGTPVIKAAKQATQTIPIVFAVAGDPVGTGLVTPGGNATGWDLYSPETGRQQLEVFRQVVPGLSRVGLLRSTATTATLPLLEQLRAAGGAAGVQTQLVEIKNGEELEGAFAALAREKAQGVIVLSDPLLFGHRQRIGELARETRLPTLSQEADYVVAGGLVAYGPDLVQQFRHAATYVDKILKGTKPGDLPVQPVPARLVVNLGTAKALGLEVPQPVLARADRVIKDAGASAATGSTSAPASGAQPAASPK